MCEKCKKGPITCVACALVRLKQAGIKVVIRLLDGTVYLEN
jgi:hypothetical protein